MAKGGPGTAGIISLVAFYGVYYCLSEGRIKLNKYGDDRYFSWSQEPVLFAAAVASMAIIGVLCLWVWWSQRK